MHILDALRSYEVWLGGKVTLVPEDLQVKHDHMAISPFYFLRATYFRWAQEVSQLCKDISRVPEALCVGDLHIENFGTWRDQEGRLVWGINDFDEASYLPFTHDLLRLAVSAYLAVDEGHLKVKKKDASEAIVKGYLKALDKQGQPFVLEERHSWLRKIALSKLKEPVRFWQNLENLPREKRTVPEEVSRLLLESLPSTHADIKISKRISGLGSLGLQKFLVLTKWEGGYICREIKPLIPPVKNWLKPDQYASNLVREILSKAIRCPDPFVFLHERWVIRRLSPHCSKINLNTMPEKRDEYRLLEAMGYEVANIHLGTLSSQQIKKTLENLPENWLHRNAIEMRRFVREDFENYIQTKNN